MGISDSNDNDDDDIEYDQKYNDNTEKLRKENDDLRAEIALKVGFIKDLHQKMKKAEREKTENEQIQNQLKQEKVEIQQKYNDVNAANIKLNEECKELQMELH